MFHPLPLYVGLRYARARTHRYFVSFITWVSLVGVCVGVAALIVILSVMNGFEGELRSRLLALSEPVRVSSTGAEHADWAEVARELAGLAGVTSVEPYADMQVLAVRQAEMQVLRLRAAGEATTADLGRFLIDGELAVMQRGDGVLLGELVARQLGVAVGDPITLMIPGFGAGDVLQVPMREFSVAGIFEAGIQDHDGSLVYASPAVLDSVGAGRSGAKGLGVRLPEPLAAPELAQRVQQVLAARWPGQFTVSDWTREHASYFRATKIEKTMIALILLMVVAVASFNIVAMLVMVVGDKRTDIAILRTFGASPRAMAAVFVWQGLVIGWLGVLVGVGLGWLIADNVSPILQFLKDYAGLQLFDEDVFYITQVPSELHGTDVVLVAGCALVITALATIFPARRAAATSPAEALRYE